MRNPSTPWMVLLFSGLLCLAGPLGYAEDEPEDGAADTAKDTATDDTATEDAAAEDGSSSDKYSPKELEEIVGPVALYPDVVLSSLLPASTAPIDVVQAARYVKAQGGEVKEVPDGVSWDDSVKGLMQFPDVLQWMSENLDWLEQLGYAVAVQEDDVLEAIQQFRRETEEAGNLKSDDHQNVEVSNENIITIEPTDPEVVYVPQYEPAVVVQPYVGGV